MSDPWHVVQSKPAQESRALENLTRQHIRAYCPLYRTAQGKVRPLFPSYLFVSFGPDFAWGVIANTFGVARMLLVGGIPGNVPAGLMDELLVHEGYLTLDERKIAPAFAPGDSVRIRDGAPGLGGLVGEFIRLEPHDRCRLLLSMLGGRVPVTVSLDKVEPLIDDSLHPV